jgi:hypothetical protein
VSNEFLKWWKENGIKNATQYERAAARKGWDAAMTKAAQIVDSDCTDVRNIDRQDDRYAAMTANAVLGVVRDKILSCIKKEQP